LSSAEVSTVQDHVNLMCNCTDLHTQLIVAAATEINYVTRTSAAIANLLSWVRA